jgi:NADPH2:quinone reductase
MMVGTYPNNDRRPSMTPSRRVKLDAFGGPDVMQIETVDLPAPAPGQVLIRNTVVGFNYIDVYQRKGVYPLPLPTGLGHEAAAIVEAVGEGVRDLAPGDRVVYMNAGLGAYADRRNVPADRLVTIPPTVTDEQAASLFFKGLTAHYLVKKTYAIQVGDIVLVHAAAGGVGQILCRWAKALGAFVIGTASSPDKCEQARAAGCDVAIDYTNDDWPAQVLAASGGKKARVVYDSVGKDTFMKSLDCVAPFGMVVVFGAASGPIGPIDPELLNKKGCLFLTRPSVFPHNADVATFRANARDLFDAIAAGHVDVTIGARFALDDVAKAHAAAEARSVKGAILIIP